ncbi:MAG: hypothetical protein Kow0080_21340 [Candidatus Promineifilaceae bacterium]
MKLQRLHSFASQLVAISLLLQLFLPLFALPTAVSTQAQTLPTEPATAAAAQPAAIESPITIYRTQSAYTSGSTIDIVYTITNNQMPTRLPEIPDTATITDTVDTLAAFDLTADVNTLHGVTLQTTLTNGTLINGNGAAVSGSTLTWTIDDLPPMNSTAITMTILAPANAATFVELDSGAVVSATLWDTPAAATAVPAHIIPDSISTSYLAATPDTDTTDTTMLLTTATFAQSPAEAFALVQSYANDPYTGSLRGTRGTILGQAGNSLDKASALIAMLRAAGIPARYRHGTLSQADAQTLIAAMFANISGSAGNIPAGTNAADPLNDPALLAIVQDHWWVEAYLPETSSWTDLDPAFANAAPSNSFATPGTNDRVAEIPDTLRHKTAVSVRREYYSSFPIGGIFLLEEDVMSVEYATAQLAGHSLTFAHMVDTDQQLGLTFGTTTHTYTPYFVIDDNTDDAILGTTFQDMLTTFPLATNFTTAAWLTFTITDTNGTVETFERTLKDDLGPDVRLNGGAPNLARDENSPAFFGSSDLMTTVFLPNAIQPQAIDQIRGTMLGNLVDTAVTIAAINTLQENSTPSPEEDTLAAEAMLASQILYAKNHTITAFDFAISGDELLQQISHGLQVKMFYAQPRIVTLTTTADEITETTTESMDLRSTTAVTIPAPGQSTTAVQTANWLKGVGESALEGAALDAFYDDVTAVTTARIFTDMHTQGITPVRFTQDNIDQLNLYPFPADTKALITTAALDGKTILIPAEAVLINGSPTFGWWQIDPTTGETIGVLEDGSHGALFEYLNWLGYKRFSAIKRLFGTPVKYLYKYLVKHIVPALGGTAPRAAAPATLAATTNWRYLPAHLCPVENCGTEQFFLPDITASPVPLPDMTFAYQQPVQSANAFTTTKTAISSSGGGGSSNASLAPTPVSAAITPFETASFNVGLTANFADDFILQLHAPSGWHAVLNGTNATITPPVDAAAGSYEVVIVAQSQNLPTVTATAVFPITISVPNQMAFAAAAEPNITIPQNAALITAVSNQTNDGEAEIPDSAYRIDITNQSGTTKTFNVTVSGAPAGWVILNGTQQTTAAVTLSAGQSTTLGLYLVPDAMPASGTSHTITVAINDGDTLSNSTTINWVMPGQAHNYIMITPSTLYMQPNSTVTFDLTMLNVGNNTGSFPITATSRLTTATFSNLQSPIALASGANNTQTATLNIGDAVLGNRYPLQIASSAPNGYTQYALADVQIVSPVSGVIFEAAASCTMDSDALASALETAAINAVQLEYWCDQGNCPLILRDNVANAAESAATYADSLSFGSGLATTDPLRTAATALSAQTTDADILSALADVSTAVSNLHTDLCEVEEHRVSATFTPYLDAVLLGNSASFTLDVTNLGTITTTYAITVTGTPGGDQMFTPTINPGQTTSLPVNVTPVSLGSLDLNATAAATAPDVVVPVGTSASARLNVVDKFVQVTAVTPNPAFVDTGTSQTTLSIDIDNVAGIAQTVTAQTEVHDANGTLQATLSPELTVLIGPARTYTLGTIDTSGWAEGTYTITVTLLDSTNALIPEGTAQGTFAVGQSVQATMNVTPQLVPPGTVTVTSIITTELQANAILTTPQTNALPWPATGLRTVTEAVENAPPPTARTQEIADTPRSPTITSQPPVTNTQSPDLPAAESPELPAVVTGTIILRHEQDEAAVTGTWDSFSNTEASGGTYLRANTAGESATFTVSGTWLNIGFIGDNWSGHADITIDGISQGTFDLYRREAMPVSFVFGGLASGTHTVVITALGTHNTNATTHYVQLDYLDVYNGGSYTDGIFEQDDTRLFLSTGWSTIADTSASSGSYIRHAAATAWFPFTGDSVTYQALAYNGGGKVDVSIDGVYQTTVDLYNPLTAVTRTLSFNGLGTGPHILQINSYRDMATIDALITPGTAPFYTAPTPGSFTRYEEEHPAFLFNGVPFTTTAQTWTRASSVLQSEVSGGQRVYSNTPGDTVTFTFSGVWTAVGFFTTENGGHAELFLDGVSQGIIDLYSNEEDVTSVAYAGLAPGVHTLTITVLGTNNILSGDSYVQLDYVDVWDGTSLPTGVFEQTDTRVLRSGGWWDVADTNASGGSYSEAVLHGQPTAWFPFTGDSVTYQAFDYFRSDEVAIYIDEVFQGYYDIRTGSAPTLTHSFDNLGAGLHILKIRNYREEPTLDAFITPAVSPQTPPAAQVFTRHEENDTAVSYNGLPYATTASSWSRTNSNGRASGGQYIYSSTAGDTISMAFTGTWINVGFATSRLSGQAEISIDGISQGIVDLYTRDDDVASFVYGGLADTSHTITVTVLGTSNPNANGTQVLFDYFDTWDGTSLPNNTYEQDHTLVYRSDIYDDWELYSDTAASGGSYITDDFFSNDGTVWFPFTGDSVTFLGMATSSGAHVEISIDGVSQGLFNLYNNVPISRAISFNGLGSGPHIIQIRHNQGEPGIDAFVTPGSAPFYTPPAYTGIVRHEEDHPNMVYNELYNWRARPQEWSRATNSTHVSGGQYVYASSVGSSASLTFDGSWAAVGFRVRNSTSQAELFIDGMSQGILDLSNPAGEDVRIYSFGDLITGTHTISVTVVAGTVYLDYIDTWDGQPMPDDFANAAVSEDNGRIHFTSNIVDVTYANAREDNYTAPTLSYAASNIWYSFVGDSFTLYGVTRQFGNNIEVYIDGTLLDTPDFTYPYTEQTRNIHYTGLTTGPHIVRVRNGSSMRLDGFQSNPTDLSPFQPVAEWWDNAPAGNGAPFFGTYGIGAGMTAGDINSDGIVELVVSSDDMTNFGSLFVYRGDGADAGGGTPLLWSHDFGGGAYRTWVSSPALGDLDGLPGSEIVVAAGNELWAFHSDGTTYWMTSTVSIFETLSAPAIANLDLDPEPEIVVNLGNTIEVREYDGTLAWSTVYPANANPPVLADLTNDGLLDIVITGWDDDVLVYDYNNGTPQLVWSAVLTSSMAGTFGAPAVANVTGDAAPEVIVSHYGALSVLNGADGTAVWTTTLDPGNPGGVSVADLDGDGAVEILTGMRYEFEPGRFGMLYALETDGSLLWNAIAEDSSSANNAAALDLDGDGAYEVAWNGQEQGFTIYSGTDGAIIFNEPLANSATGTDYPLFVDVDGDSYAEVVVPTIGGIVVFGQDGAWDVTRPLWNQHSYHITNINDDLTIPVYELNSWDVHNTYRTQWPQASVMPVYDMTIAYTAGPDQITVLTPTLSLTPTTAVSPLYTFDYTQEWFQPIITATLDSEAANLQPGELRQIAEGAVVTYSLPSGTNVVTLPPLFIQAAHLVTLAQDNVTVTAGETAVITATLSNPGNSPDTFTINLAGPTAGWVDYPATVDVPAGGETTVVLTLTVPAGASADVLPILLDVANGGGAEETGQIELTILPAAPNPFTAPPTQAVALTVTPETAVGGPGVTTRYDVSVANLGNQPDTYDLVVSAPVGWLAELRQNGTAVSSLTVPSSPYAQTVLQLLVTPPAGEAIGSYPVTITAVSQTDTAVTTTAVATHTIGTNGVAVTLSPAGQTVAHGSTTTWNMAITNTGSVANTYDLAAAGVAAPWVTLDSSSVTLSPGQAQVVVVTAANVGLLPQTVPLVVAATSQANPAVAAEANSNLTVTAVSDAAVSWTPASRTVTDTLATTFSLVITNTGNVLTTYDVGASVVGGSAQVGSAQVIIPAGGTAVVPITVNVTQPGTYAVTGTAVVPDGSTHTAAATFTATTTQSGLLVYLPIVVKP